MNLRLKMAKTDLTFDELTLLMAIRGRVEIRILLAHSKKCTQGAISTNNFF